MDAETESKPLLEKLHSSFATATGRTDEDPWQEVCWDVAAFVADVYGICILEGRVDTTFRTKILALLLQVHQAVPKEFVEIATMIEGQRLTMVNIPLHILEIESEADFDDDLDDEL